mmetsp:Transcript_88129/g.262779  ORF Transcript_88129/g.262779 Transcript_88129/m.262779 type:complete len:541 (+) Transcript_88129:3-1625(+)
MGELTIERNSTGRKLKNCIAAVWHLPPDCQELIIGTTVVSDQAFLTHIQEEANSLSVTLVVSLERVYQRLGDTSPKVRQKAVQAIAHVAQRGDETAINALGARLQDPSGIVRGAAVKGLARLAEKGDARTLGSIIEHVESPDPGVRRAALEALGHIADDGNELVVQAASAHLEDPHAFVRLAAAEVLCRVAVCGDKTFPHTGPAHAGSLHTAVPDQARQPYDSGRAARSSEAGGVQQTRCCGDPNALPDWPVRGPRQMPDASIGAKAPAANIGAEAALGGHGVTCPEGHALRRIIASSFRDAAFECDGCGVSLPCGSPTYSCRRCDYDLCEQCCIQRWGRDDAAAPSRWSVTVRGSTGVPMPVGTALAADEASFTLVAGPSWTAGDVKRSLAAEFGVPTLRQRLFGPSGGELQDFEVLWGPSQQGSGGSSLELLLALRSEEEHQWLREVQLDGSALAAAPEHLRADRNFVLTAVLANGMALQAAPRWLLADRAFMLKAVTKNGFALQYAADELRGDSELVAAAVRQDCRAAQHATCSIPE